MNWYIKSFQEFSADELYQIIKARVDVFVVEQACPYYELDNHDQRSIHYYLKVDNEIAAYVRIVPKESKYPEVSIGRVLVSEKFRGQGYAKEIMQRAIEYIFEEWNENKIKIQAQEYLKKFYSSFGFRQISDSYLEDNIPHIDMILEKK
ncbi:GNAT family N-acetyltransferase [Virgibacillus oceani]|uniref:Acetyltransferase n=1 Tax=Virgibacillus oceani TaxID=1479511 RepID=A0A917M6C8_9BACI|nr:GNAT family N-acetyltransferase [Virgibacillus oceani]GGG81794.1 acetyltransferase [Virgibacillus oceani]